jgi:hypothetical protein
MLNFLKSLWKYFIFILPIVFIIPGCGGGGGDSGGGGTPAPTVPTVLNYSVGTSTMTPLLTGTSADGTMFNVTSINLAGTYNRSTTATTLAENKSMFFTVSGGPLGATSVQIVTPAGSTAQWNSGDNPTSGMFDVNSTHVGPYRVKVNNSIPGVEIYFNGSLVRSMTWAYFKSAVEISVNPEEILTSLAYNALQSVYRCMQQAYTVVEIVMENQDTLTQGGIDVRLVTSLPGFPSNIHVQWGGNSSGNISPGDNFLSRFSNWWVDNPGSNQDYFYNGRLLWLDYWEGTNASGTFVGGDFKIGVSGDPFYEEEVNNNTPDPGTRMTYQESGFLFLLSW